MQSTVQLTIIQACSQFVRDVMQVVNGGSNHIRCHGGPNDIGCHASYKLWTQSHKVFFFSLSLFQTVGFVAQINLTAALIKSE